MFIINSLAPIFLLIALGNILHRTSVFPETFFKSLNRLVFWFALPALLISRISVAELEFSAISRIVLLLVLAVVMTLIVAWLIAAQMKLPHEKRGSFIQGAFRGNGAFIGLPVIIYSLGSLDPRAEVLGTVVLAPLVVLYNILGVTVLIHYGKEKHSARSSIITFFRQLLTNPLVLACAIGLLLNVTGLRIPTPLYRPIDALGDAALPLILLSIGSSLTVEPLRGAASPSLISSVIKLAIAPLLGFLLSGLLNLDATERMIAIFYLACPAAGMSYVMAEVMGNDATLAGRIVALSTLLSAISLPIIMALCL
jgi:predicted permease